MHFIKIIPTHEIGTTHEEHLLCSLLLSQLSEPSRMKWITEAKWVELQSPEISKKNESMFRLRDFCLVFLKILSFLMRLIGNNFSAFSSLSPYLRISTSAVLAYLGLFPNPITEYLLCFDACSVAEQMLLIIKKRWDGRGLGCVHFRELTTMAVWRLEAPGGRGVSPWVLSRVGTGSEGCPTATGRIRASGELGQP